MLRALGWLLALAVVVPVVWVFASALRHDRDLAGAVRALRAPRPRPAAKPVPVDPAPFAPAVFAGILRDPWLAEVSGLAASRRRPDVLWAVNDSGNLPRVFALSHGGDLLRLLDVTLPAADRDGDWEDLAAFEYAGTPYLLVADVGDNDSWRRSVQLWVIEEPVLTQGWGPIFPKLRIDLRYPDGPRDCEAVAVDEHLNALLISKRDAPPRLYEVALAPLLAAGGGAATARRVGELRGLPPPSTELAESFAPSVLHMPTALDLAPDGSAAVVLSYAAAWYYPRRTGESWAQALARKPQQIALPAVPLAEAAAFAGRSLYVTGEREPFALIRWRAPLVRFDPSGPPLP